MTKDVRSSSSLRSSAGTLRRIPQAVSTVATEISCDLLINSRSCFNTASGRHYYFITFVFPSFQSGTRDVRTSSSLHSSAASHPSSHTANGRHCCNSYQTIQNQRTSKVSIPQAVGTVATKEIDAHMGLWFVRFNTASGKHCCNLQRNFINWLNSF